MQVRLFISNSHQKSGIYYQDTIFLHYWHTITLVTIYVSPNACPAERFYLLRRNFLSDKKTAYHLNE